MDKQTLSNYGWVIVLILVLSVLLALATPFGSFIAEGFKSTYVGLGNINNNTMEVGLSSTGIKNTYDCGHEKTANGDHSQKGCGHFACKECDCVPAPCGIEGHWSDDGLDHTRVGHTIATYKNPHAYACQCERWTIPEGGIYKTSSKTYNAGDQLPCEYKSGATDRYYYEDYLYSSSSGVVGKDGWKVSLNHEASVSKDKTEYSAILESINGRPVIDLTETFKDCKKLIVAPEIPASVLNIKSTFKNCNSLTTAPAIPSSVTTIVDTFAYCYALESVPTIPDTVTNITNGAFESCTSLATIKIPSSVTNIGINAFATCRSLENIIFDGTMEQWNNIVFHSSWNNKYTPATYIQCSDGIVELN